MIEEIGSMEEEILPNPGYSSRRREKHKAEMKNVKTAWHGFLEDEWEEQNKTSLPEPLESKEMDIGVTFDQKLLYISVYILGSVGPTVQIAFIIAIILFYTAEKLMMAHCNVRRSPLFTDSFTWNSTVLRHGGFSDAFLAWHYFVLYILQAVLGVLILCDNYVYVVHTITQEKMQLDGHCMAYNEKSYKTLVFIPIWFTMGVLMTGTYKQHKEEQVLVNSLANWCMRLEIMGLMLIGHNVWIGQDTLQELIKAYDNFDIMEVKAAVPIAAIILHQYWIDIPNTFGDSNQTYPDCRIYYIAPKHRSRLILICIFLGLVQPFYVPHIVFHDLKQKCLPFWTALQSDFLRTTFHFIRVIHVLASLYISMYFSCRALENLAKSGLASPIFFIRNPFNKSPIVALTFVSLVTGILASLLSLKTLFDLQGANIVFFRILLSLTILLRKHYIKAMLGRLDENWPFLKGVKKPLRLDLRLRPSLQGRANKLNKLTAVFFFMSVIGMMGLYLVSEYLLDILWEQNFTIGLPILTCSIILCVLIVSPLIFLTFQSIIIWFRNKRDGRRHHHQHHQLGRRRSGNLEAVLAGFYFLVNISLVFHLKFFSSFVLVCLFSIGLLVYLPMVKKYKKQLREKLMREAEEAAAPPINPENSEAPEKTEENQQEPVDNDPNTPIIPKTCTHSSEPETVDEKQPLISVQA